MLTNFVSDTALGCDESRRDNDSRFAIIFQTIKQMLEETEINLHPRLVLVGDIGNPSEETALIGVVLQIAMIVGEVEFERWITDYIVKLP